MSSAPVSAPTNRATLLVFRAGAALAALPVEHVLETMRPLGTTPVASAPPYVLGAAVVRGAAVPVIDLARLLVGESAPVERWVTLRAGTRTVALAVGEVLGIRRAGTDHAPALVGGVATSVLDGLGVLDRALLVVLASARVMSESAWKAFDEARVS